MIVVQRSPVRPNGRRASWFMRRSSDGDWTAI